MTIITTLLPRAPFLVSLTLASTLLLGCEQPPPPGFESGTSAESEDSSNDTDTSGSTDTDTTDTEAGDGDGDPGDGDGDDPFADTLYPLIEGATWHYIAKNYSGQILNEEMVETFEIDWEGQIAWMLVDNPGPAGNYTQSTIIRDGQHTMRVHKEIQGLMGTSEIVDYDPGFTRAHDGWSMVGQSEEYFYDRTATDGMGLNPVVEPRGHIYTVLDVGVEVTVPAGTFDCIEVERVRSVGTSIGERVVFWYARGVGKIREERPAESRIEELVSVSIPGGAQYP